MSNTTIASLTSPESVASLSALLRSEAAENGYTEQEQAYGVYSDLYKEEWGVRPRFAAQDTFEELVNSIISVHVDRLNRVDMEKRYREAVKAEKAKRREILKNATTRTPVSVLGDFWPS